MHHAFLEHHRLQVAHEDRSLGEHRVEFCEQRFILRQDRADGHLRPVFGCPGSHVLDRVGTDGQLGQLFLLRVLIEEHHAGIQSDQFFRRCHQRIDVQFLDPALFGDQLREADQQALESSEIDRIAAAYTFQGGVDLGPFHHAPRQRRCERWQSEGAIFEDLHQLTAKPKQQDGSKLWIDAAAEDQLIPIDLRHRLDGDTQEVLRSDLFCDRFFDAGIGVLYRLGIRQVQLDTAHVGLVGDRLRMELEDHRIANCVGSLDGFLLAFCNARFDSGNAVTTQELLGFIFGQDGAARRARSFDNAVGTFAIQLTLAPSPTGMGVSYRLRKFSE